MKEYVKIEADVLKKLHERSKAKDEYIEELELALKSVKRQLENIKEANNAKT